MAMGDVLAAGTIGFDPVNNPQFSVSEEELALHDPNMPTISRPALEPLQAPTILTPEQEEFYYSDISPFKEGRALPGTNSQITMAQIRTEVSGSGQCSLNDAEFRALINKNSGQQQAMSDYWGKSSELVYGQNTAAQGGFGSIGGGPNYDYGTTGNANRYVKGGVKNTTVNSYVECSYWVFIPLSQPINRGTVLKLDYSFTHNVNFQGNQYAVGYIYAGSLDICPQNALGQKAFLAAAYNNNSFRMKRSARILVTGDASGNYGYLHIDGSEVQKNDMKYTSKAFSESTYFTWDASDSYQSTNGFAVEAATKGFNGYHRSDATVNFKLTEM